MMRRTEDGAVKCALRLFRREDDTALEHFISLLFLPVGINRLVRPVERKQG